MKFGTANPAEVEMSIDDVNELFAEWLPRAVAPPPLAKWAYTIQELYNGLGHDWYFRLRMLALMKEMWREQYLIEMFEGSMQHDKNGQRYAQRIRFIKTLLEAVLDPAEDRSANATALADAISDGLPPEVYQECLERAAAMLAEWPKDYTFCNGGKL